MSGQSSIGMWFLECSVLMGILLFCMYGGFHCCRWTKHCHGAHQAWKKHDEEQRWGQIEQHFLERFENQAGNGHPAIEVSLEDGGGSRSPGVSSVPPTMDGSSSPIPEPVAEMCHQSTQVYTCGRGARKSCQASTVQEV